MDINLKFGIEKLIFGMNQKEVIKIVGKPDKIYNDEEENIIYIYNKDKLAVTFYEAEALKLGYIVTTNPNLKLFGEKIIGRNFELIKAELFNKGISKFTIEIFDNFENYFFESDWITFQVEFNEIIKFEIGAIINENDEFDWKF